jgi:omega-amidase
MNIKISLAQMHIQNGKVEENLICAESMIADAAKCGSSLVMLPELWSSGYDLVNASLHAVKTPLILEELCALSNKLDIHIIGSLLEPSPDRPRNTLFWFTPGVKEPLAYSKIHLFHLLDEEKWLTAGDHLQQGEAPWGMTGLAICYDLRFPELFRRYALNGVRVFTICAEWPAQRISHWQTLLRSRAIENQAFVFGVNCFGKSGSETFGGKSAVISPWGETLQEASQTSDDLLTVEIDTSQVDEARSFMPIFRDRRPDLYSSG